MKREIVRCFYCCKAVLTTSPNYMQGGLRMVRHYNQGEICEGYFDLTETNGHPLKSASELLESEKKRLVKYFQSTPCTKESKSK
jgi:hypothetical protein